MPLIVITGPPASGKTTRLEELKEFFKSQEKEVHVVSEYEQILKAGYEKNKFFQDASKEKHIRGLLKSEVLRLVTPSNVVILDALNYIKGYRYELYCGTKANKSTQCTIHTEINRVEAWTFNENRENEEEKYDRETFDALMQRFEDPDGKNRWDAPLYVLFPTYTLDKDAIYSCLFKKAPPRPNMSTQNPPLSSTNFLYDLDQTTKNITDTLVKAKNNGVTGVVEIPGYDDLSVDITDLTVQQLLRLRRQYLTYSKMHQPEISQIPQLFVQYLTTTYN